MFQEVFKNYMHNKLHQANTKFSDFTQRD